MTKVIDVHAVKSPNIRAMKFEVPSLLLTRGAFEFNSLEEAAASPLARKLFGFDYVERVFIAKNFVTVTKTHEEVPSWDEVLIDLRIVIKKHLENGEPLFNFDAETSPEKEPLEGKAELIRGLIERQIHPATWHDGGEINFESYEDGLVKVKLAGACVTCPFAPRTLKHGLQVILQRSFPDDDIQVTSDDVDWTQTQEA